MPNNKPKWEEEWEELVKVNFSPQCESCKAGCRIEGWDYCWSMCSCCCHLEVSGLSRKFNKPTKDASDLIKTFIRSELQKQKEEIVEMIKSHIEPDLIDGDGYPQDENTAPRNNFIHHLSATEF